MLMLLLIVVIGLGIYHYCTHYSRDGRLLNKLPGPPVIPLLGNLNIFMVSQDELFYVGRRHNRKYPKVNKMWFGHICDVNIMHPDDAEILLSSNKLIQKSRLYNFLHPWLKTGLLTSTGEKWRSRRRMLTPAFHFSILQQFLEVFVEQGNRFVQLLKSKDDDHVEDIVPLFTKYTLNTICETAMGTSLDDADISNQYGIALRKVTECVVHRLCRPWLNNDWIFKLIPTGKIHYKYLSTLHNFSTKIIEERQKYHGETEDKYLKSIISADEESISSDDGIKGRKRRMAMLDHLIAAQKFKGNINDEGIREEVDTFVFEGHDTTAIALCFVLLLLAEHKDVQDRAREEVDEVLDGKNGKIGTAEIQRLNYLEQCIKESLRLYPSVHLISRVTNEDLQLKNYLIPAGTSIHLSIFDLHRDPDFWPDPEKFDPDRFLPERMQNRHPFSYIPFSGGPRNCIGQKFAMLEIKALMAHLLWNFTFEPIDFARDVIFTADLILRPKVPMRVKFISRIR